MTRSLVHPNPFRKQFIAAAERHAEENPSPYADMTPEEIIAELMAA